LFRNEATPYVNRNFKQAPVRLISDIIENLKIFKLLKNLDYFPILFLNNKNFNNASQLGFFFARNIYEWVPHHHADYSWWHG
jgi:hypothetical protein